MNKTNWLKLALGLASVIVVWIMNQQANGTLVLPSSVATVLLIVKTVLGQLTDGVPTVQAKRMAMKAAAKTASVLALVACFIVPISLPVGVVVAPMAVAEVACSAAQSTAAQSAVPALVDCVYKQVDGCIQAKTPWLTCTEQTAVACGIDAASVASIWLSKRASEAREVDAGSYPVGYP